MKSGLLGIKGEDRKLMGVLFLVPLFFGIGIIIVIGFFGSDLLMLSMLSALFCICGFISTIIIFRYRQKKLEKKFILKQESDESESPPILLGAGGLYGLIMGLGIYEALTN